MATINRMLYVLPPASVISHETLTLTLNAPKVTEQVAELGLAKPVLGPPWRLSAVGVFCASWEALSTCLVNQRPPDPKPPDEGAVTLQFRPPRAVFKQLHK